MPGEVGADAAAGQRGSLNSGSSFAHRRRAAREAGGRQEAAAVSDDGPAPAASRATTWRTSAATFRAAALSGRGTCIANATSPSDGSPSDGPSTSMNRTGGAASGTPPRAPPRARRAGRRGSACAAPRRTAFRSARAPRFRRRTARRSAAGPRAAADPPTRGRGDRARRGLAADRARRAAGLEADREVELARVRLVEQERRGTHLDVEVDPRVRLRELRERPGQHGVREILDRAEANRPLQPARRELGDRPIVRLEDLRERGGGAPHRRPSAPAHARSGGTGGARRSPASRDIWRLTADGVRSTTRAAFTIEPPSTVATKVRNSSSGNSFTGVLPERPRSPITPGLSRATHASSEPRSRAGSGARRERAGPLGGPARPSAAIATRATSTRSSPGPSPPRGRGRW